MTLPTGSILELNKELKAEVEHAKELIVVFDHKLNYAMLNESACRRLNRTVEELIGKNILDLYPEIIASGNHKNLLKALSGETISEYVLQSRTGENLHVSYEPITENEKVVGILTRASEVR